MNGQPVAVPRHACAALYNSSFTLGCGPEDKAALDYWYIQNISLALYIRIALRTCAVVIAGERVEQEAVLSSARGYRASGTGPVLCTGRAEHSRYSWLPSESLWRRAERSFADLM